MPIYTDYLLSPKPLCVLSVHTSYAIHLGTGSLVYTYFVHVKFTTPLKWIEKSQKSWRHKASILCALMYYNSTSTEQSHSVTGITSVQNELSAILSWVEYTPK